jgi:hypothetical protein
MYLFMALRGEIPAPAMIVSPGECATRPHRTGRVPHPSGDIIPDIRTPIRISPLTLAEQLRGIPHSAHFAHCCAVIATLTPLVLITGTTGRS